MPALQVRDLPQSIYDQLVDSARIEHRSLAQQTTYILEQHFREDAKDAAVGKEHEGSESDRAIGYAHRVPRAIVSEDAKSRRERKLALLAACRSVLGGAPDQDLTPPEDMIAALRGGRNAHLFAAAGIERASVEERA